MLKCLIALTSLFSATVLAVPVWTWVDESGQRHYSDRPVEGATQIEIGTPQTFTGSASEPAAPPTAVTPAATEQGPAYTVLDIISPTQEETISNTGGEMTVELATSPALRAVHTIDLILDGQPLGASGRNLSIMLTGVERGEHTLEAVIFDSDGDELMRSVPVTFFIRQASALN